MDQFLQVAGVVGFIASQENLMSLFDRVVSLLSHHDSDYTEELKSRFESCKRRFHITLLTAASNDGALQAPEEMLCIAAVRKKLEQICRKLAHATDVRGHVICNTMSWENISKDLDETDKLISDLSDLTLRGGTAALSCTADVWKLEQERMTLLASLLKPGNKKPLGRKEMREKGLYVGGAASEDAETCTALTAVAAEAAGGGDGAELLGRFVSWGGKDYVVDRVGFGSTNKDKERKLSRLGRLILNMRDWEDPCVAKMALVAEMRDSFWVLSELGGRGSSSILTKFRPLEDALLQFMQQSGRTIGAGSSGAINISSTAGCSSSSFVYAGDADPRQRMELLVKIASAIQKLHDQMILHEGIGSHNVLVSAVRDLQDNVLQDDAGQQGQRLEVAAVQLAGFVSARLVDDVSDRPASTSPEQAMLERRRRIYQSPWRLAGSRYSFECDVYSFGVVMAELQCAASFVRDSSIDGREDILAALSRAAAASTCSCPAIATLARECMSNEASMVPPIDEVLERLERMRDLWPCDP